MSTSITIAAPTNASWSKLIIALLSAIAVSAIYVGSLTAIIHIASHWTPPLIVVCGVFGAVSVLCCVIVVALFSRAPMTTRSVK
jgi:ABC-type transport system involved in multi-copper enzyme maturation permease subunit